MATHARPRRLECLQLPHFAEKITAVYDVMQFHRGFPAAQVLEEFFERVRRILRDYADRAEIAPATKPRHQLPERITAFQSQAPAFCERLTR